MVARKEIKVKEGNKQKKDMVNNVMDDIINFRTEEFKSTADIVRFILPKIRKICLPADFKEEAADIDSEEVDEEEVGTKKRTRKKAGKNKKPKKKTLPYYLKVSHYNNNV